MRSFHSLLALLFIASTMSPTSAQIHIWLSNSSGPSGATVPTQGAEFEIPFGETSEVYVWAKPETNETLRNFALNVISSSESTLTFLGVEIDNGQPESPRFEFLFDSANGLDIDNQGLCFPSNGPVDFDNIPTHALWGFRGFSIDADNGGGITAQEAGVLLATIEVNPLEFGDAELFLQIGDIGINQLGEETDEAFVRFGHPNDGLLNGKSQRCLSSDTADATLTVVDAAEFQRGGIVGDFDEDGTLDADDIDLLSQEVLTGNNTASFNLNGDAGVDQDDRIFWVENLKGTLFGDANFDNTVNFLDFLVLSSGFNQPGGWAQGDFSGDQEVNFSDFLQMSNNFNQSAAASVPEPQLPAWFVVVLALVMWVRRPGMSDSELC